MRVMEGVHKVVGAAYGQYLVGFVAIERVQGLGLPDVDPVPPRQFLPSLGHIAPGADEAQVARGALAAAPDAGRRTG